MRFKELQPSFTGGEISPDLYGRVDFQAYDVSVAEMTNMFARKQGGAYRRAGTYFVRETKSSGQVYLMPFSFGWDQAYILEFGDYYLRFYYNYGVVLNAGVPYEITTPFTAAQMFEAKYIQSNDVVFIVHGSHAPKVLKRKGHTNWTLTDVEFTDGPYLPEKNDLTITPSAQTGTVTLTASASIFEAGHVGTLWRLRHKDANSKTVWGYCQITAVASGTSATATVKRKFGNTNASEYYREGAFSTVRGYPKAVRIMHERLALANHSDNPQRIWFSKTGDWGDPSNFTPDTGAYYDTDGTTVIHADADALADDAINVTISDGKVNVIHWLEQGSGVLVTGTSGSEFRIAPGGNDAAIAPDSINVTRQTSIGSSTLQGEYIQNAILFVSSSGKKLHDFVYDFSSDSYRSPDLVERATHLTDYNKITGMAYQKEPYSILWFMRNDGLLMGFTYERENKVLAWHKHQLGGDDIVESLAVIQAPDLSRYDLWLVVRRTINGTTKRYIEYMKGENPQYQKDCFYVDCGLTYSGAATSSVSGLDHLEGATVHILADGATHPTRVVSGGAITLDAAYSTIHVGLPYKTILKTLPLATKNAVMTDQGQNKRIVKVIVRCDRSLGIAVGADENTLDETVLNGGVVMGVGTPLFTGDAEIPFNGDYETRGQVVIAQNYPLPMNIVGVMLDGEVVD